MWSRVPSAIAAVLVAQLLCPDSTRASQVRARGVDEVAKSIGAVAGATGSDAQHRDTESASQAKRRHRARKPDPRKFDFAEFFGRRDSEECGSSEVRLDDIIYFDFDKDGAEEAIIQGWSPCGGNVPDIQGVFKLTAKGDVVELTLDRSATFNGRCIQCGIGCWKSGSSLLVKNGQLVQEFVDGSGVPNPLAIFYTWNGNGFQISRVEKHPEVEARIERSEAARRTIRTIAESEAARLMTAYRIPTRASGPHGIVAGPDGAMWFAEMSANKIGRLVPESSAAVTEIPVSIPSKYPTLGSQPCAIKVGPDGAIWFSAVSARKLARFWPRDPSRIEAFDLPTGPVEPYRFAVGPEGRAWIGTGQPAGFVAVPPIEVFHLPGGEGSVRSLTVSPDGSVWFLREHRTRTDEYHEVSTWSVGHVATANLADATEIPLPGTPSDLMLGPDRALWVIGESPTAPCTEDIGRIWRISLDSAHAITEIPLADRKPIAITLGPDGNIWFTLSRDTIGRISPATPRSVTEFPVPPSPEYPVSAFPHGIAAGPDGNIWFTEANGNQIVRLDVRAANQLAQQQSAPID